MGGGGVVIGVWDWVGGDGGSTGHEDKAFCRCDTFPTFVGFPTF